MTLRERSTALPIRVQVPSAHRGTRLDIFLTGCVASMSRSQVQALINAGHAQVDGRTSRPAARLKGGEHVTLHMPQPSPVLLAAEPLKLSVLYQDADVLVLDKTAGMVVHPAAGHSSGTLVNALLHHIPGQAFKGRLGFMRPGLVHRIDKDTSGLLVVAKHDEALRILQAAFKARTVEKRYLALVCGQPADSGTFHTLYGRHPTHRVKFTTHIKSGKEAITHYTVTKRFAHAARVEVLLDTGRTHQIRVQFAEAGHPILSDALYGTRISKRSAVIPRQALHAWKLGFQHPRTNRHMCFTAPVPEDFAMAETALSREK